MTPVKGVTTILIIMAWLCHASPCIGVTGLAPVMHAPHPLILNGRQRLHIAASYKIIKGNVQLLLTCLGVTTTCNRSRNIPFVMLLTLNQQFNKLGRIDKRERTSIGAAILVEYATKRLTPNLHFFNESVMYRGLRHQVPPFKMCLNTLITAQMCSTPHVDQLRVWPKLGNEPLVDVDRAVVVTIHHRAAVLTTIRSLPQWHGLLLLTHMTHLGSIAFTYELQFFPIQQTLVGQHLHKAVESPIIIHHTVPNVSFSPLFGGLVLVFVNDHLLLGKITDDHSSFSQCARDEMRCFVQTVSLFVAFLFGNAFVHAREMNVATRLFLATVSLGTYLVQLLVVPAIALEAANAVEPALVCVTSC